MSKLVKWLAGIKKTLVAVANALVVVADSVSDGSVATDEWLLIAAAVAAVFGVYQVTNLVGAVSRKR